jgi:hypothetical protein
LHERSPSRKPPKPQWAVSTYKMSTIVEQWSRLQRRVFTLLAIAVCVLTCVYSLFIEREISSDEPGLYNAIYTFVETGRMAYPLNGQPEFMTIHPPTHYLLVGLLQKLGLSLFHAAAVPLIALTTLIAIIVATGGFGFAMALALLLACFSANVIWADYLTVRPDLHLTLAWFAGLVTLEAARNRQWSSSRLALGSALSVYAATLHYWGLAACAMPLVYMCSAALAHRHDRQFLATRFASMSIGGLAVGLPFLIWFVVPHWEGIITDVGGVQGDGGLGTAVARHLDAYASFVQRSTTSWGPRPIETAFLYPVLALRIPAVLAAVVLLFGCRRYLFAVAGSLVPAFVLLYSQGKAIGTTLYFTPEMTLYLTGAFACCFSVAQWVFATAPRPVGRLAAVVAGMLVVTSLAQVPAAAGSGWRWTKSLDHLELSRAAGFDVLGPDTLVGMISLEPWYSAGGRYAWIAANELSMANQAGKDVDFYLRSVKAFVIDRDWWHALPGLAPLGSWYLDRKLSLFGFVLPTSHSARNQFMLFASRDGPARVRGYFLSASGGQLFEQAENGMTAVSIWKCPTPVAESSFAGSFYRKGFHYNAEPGPTSPTIVILGSEWDGQPKVDEEARALGCQSRDVVRGRLTSVGAETLLSSLRQRDQRTQIAQSFSDAIAMSRGLERPGEAPSAHRVATQIIWDRASIAGLSSSERRNELPIVVKPPARPWARGATLPLRIAGDRSSDLLVRVRARIQGGDAAFWIVPPDDRGSLATAVRESSDESVTVNLIVGANLDAGSLAIMNGERGSARTLVELQAIDVFRLDPDTPLATFEDSVGSDGGPLIQARKVFCCFR